MPGLDKGTGQAPTRARGKGAKDGKEDWLLQIRLGNRANDAGRVSGGHRVGGDIFCEDRGEQLVKRISLSGYSKRLA